ncbi:Required for respiratory growth protein 9, mitochondrial [Fusarium keratoplasticum]|uniref:Required for respiratory growth protein 9, mitochondrial n=1 Tax=Fusarium keratoplasticum TaxID=1328300 RepID=A0ACC0RFS9_9HYPO|nr:Required for respiratory growth protein 9, mitochondrial [Fusarium keratoplasticum]KAI8683714.1 Required for respiratory growth protein 9, mitochondrial [Fusarium keratoplasticum]
MMGCTCRVTPLRIFVQGLSQVHKLEASPSFIRLPASATRPALYQNHFALSRQARSIHVSKQLGQDTSSASFALASSDSDTNSSPKEESAAVSSEAPQPEHPTETPDSSESLPTPATPKYQPRKNVDSYGAKWSKNVKRETSSPHRREFKGASVERPERPERPRGPSPGEPQSKVDMWKAQKAALKEKFPEGWRPRKRLSPDALAGIRALNAQFPDVYTTAALATKFEVSPEAIRRILRSKWQPSVKEEESRQERWFRRGKDVWEQKAALGIKPPQKWRREGVARDPSYHAWRQDAIQRNRENEEQDDREVHRGYRPRTGRGRS